MKAKHIRLSPTTRCEVTRKENEIWCEFQQKGWLFWHQMYHREAHWVFVMDDSIQLLSHQPVPPPCRVRYQTLSATWQLQHLHPDTFDLKAEVNKIYERIKVDMDYTERNSIAATKALNRM